MHIITYLFDLHKTLLLLLSHYNLLDHPPTTNCPVMLFSQVNQKVRVCVYLPTFYIVLCDLRRPLLLLLLLLSLSAYEEF